MTSNCIYKELMEVYSVANCKHKVQVYMNDNLRDYVENMASELSLSTSAFVVMCINIQRQQLEAIQQMAMTEEYLSKMNELLDRIEK